MLHIKDLIRYIDNKPPLVCTSITRTPSFLNNITHFHVHTQFDVFTDCIPPAGQYSTKDSVEMPRTFFTIDKITKETTEVIISKLSGFTVTTITIHFTDGSFQEHCFW